MLLHLPDFVGLSDVLGCVPGAISTSYHGAVPADLVLICGVFGNITDDDVRHTVEWLPRHCAPGATVIWTRQRRPPDLTVSIRELVRRRRLHRGRV